MVGITAMLSTMEWMASALRTGCASVSCTSSSALNTRKSLAVSRRKASTSLLGRLRAKLSGSSPSGKSTTFTCRPPAAPGRCRAGWP